MEAGDAVGVVGLGGLGHMAVKLAKAMGADVTVFTTSADKADAARALGADHVVVSARRRGDGRRPAQRGPDHRHRLRGPRPDPYFRTIRRDGALIQLGLPPEPMPPVPVNLLMRHRIAYGASIIGGIAETQEMLDFCAEHGIIADVELVRAPELNEAYDRMVAGDVDYRFVLDIASLND